MAEEADLVVIDDTIQAERPPENKREVFLRPPDWRYQAAVAYLEEERCGRTPTLPTDPVVIFTIRALRAYRRVPNRLLMDAMWNDVEETLRLGITMRHSAIVAEIEAHLISGHTVKDLKELHACHIPPMMYKLYNLIFFDLSGIVAVHSWIHTFLFEPEKYAGNQTLLRARLLAYYSSADKGANTAVFGSPDSSATAFLKKIGTNERQKSLFDYMIKHTKMPIEIYATTMEAAIKSMTERDFQEHMRDRDEAGSESLESLASGIEKGIRAYTQEELKNPNTSGEDFTNQFTEILTKKDNTDGQ